MFFYLPRQGESDRLEVPKQFSGRAVACCALKPRCEVPIRPQPETLYLNQLTQLIAQEDYIEVESNPTLTRVELAKRLNMPVTTVKRIMGKKAFNKLSLLISLPA